MKESNEIYIKGTNINNRQDSLDTLKCLLCFLVVILHTGFSDKIGLYISAFARIAVPIFFMITGYYLPLMHNDKLKRYIRKIIYLTSISTIFYIILNYACSYYGIDIYSKWFNNTLGIKEVVYWILVNVTPIAIHLWYFYALIYVLIIYYIIRKVNKLNLIYKLLPLLFLCNYLFSYLPLLYSRNFLITGLPYVLLGCIFRKHENQLIRLVSKPYILIIGFIALCSGLIIELFLYEWTGTKIFRDYYFFTLPMAAYVFLLTLKYPNIGAGSYFALIGRKYSAPIYIMHIFFIFTIQYILNSFLGEWILQNIYFKNCFPFLVFGITLISIIIGYKIWYLLYTSLSHFTNNKETKKN